MSRITARWLAVTLGIAVLLTAAVVPSDAHMRGQYFERLRTELGLTDDQVTAHRQYRDSQRDTRRQAFRSLHEARRALREMILSGAPDDAIQAKTAEVQALVAQGVEVRVQDMKHFAQILTPEQREKLKTLKLHPGHRGPQA